MTVDATARSTDGPSRTDTAKCPLPEAGAMSDNDEAGGREPDGDGHESGAGHESEFATERETAPQSDYTMRDVIFGAVVALVGAAVVFGIPLLLA